MSRRRFMALSAGMAAAWSLPRGVMGSALAAPPVDPASVPTTLLQTIRQRSVGIKEYRTLAVAPGETYTPRLDLLGKAPGPQRATQRRSLVYLGHMSDIHVIDAQSPARLEPLQQMSPTLWAGACRPQDTLTVQVQAQMVAAMAAARYSPLTGAPMAALFNTGDSADMHSDLELRWYIDMMDGQTVTPDSGQTGTYDGPQVWSGADYAYHPDGPALDRFGPFGFPTIPGMLSAAVSGPVDSPGLPVPWYAVYGNHDTLYYGTFPISANLRSLALGGRKPRTQEALTTNYLDGMAADATVLGRLRHFVATGLADQTGMESVPADPQRELFRQMDFMAQHFTTQATPGPVGHGFTQDNLDTGRTYWSADVAANLRLIGLDTCNQVSGADGAVPQEQFDWLRDELQRARTAKKMVVVISHHNSKTLENPATAVLDPDQRLVHAEEFIAALLDAPNVIAWQQGQRA